MPKCSAGGEPMLGAPGGTGRQDMPVRIESRGQKKAQTGAPCKPLVWNCAQVENRAPAEGSAKIMIYALAQTRLKLVRLWKALRHSLVTRTGVFPHCSLAQRTRYSQTA